MKKTNPTRFIALILLLIVLGIAWIVFNGGLKFGISSHDINLPF